MAHGLAKDLDRDDLDRWHLAEGDDMVDDGTHPLWDRNEVHEIYREWRRVFDRYNPPRSAVAEAWVLPERQYLYARPSELGQTFNFEFAKATWTYDDMHAAIEEGLKAGHRIDSASTWVLSNHDVPRVATRYALPQIKATRYHQIALDWLLRDGSSYDEDRELGERRARAALLLELALPGSAYVYQGEELGLFEVADIPWAALEDPTATYTHGSKREKGRDGCRVPLPWVAADDPAQGGSFGFSPADADTAPHLPQPAWFSDYAADREEADPTSMLALYRDALWLRRKLRGCANDLAWLDLNGRTGLADGAEGAEGGVIGLSPRQRLGVCDELRCSTRGAAGGPGSCSPHHRLQTAGSRRTALPGLCSVRCRGLLWRVCVCLRLPWWLMSLRGSRGRRKTFQKKFLHRMRVSRKINPRKRTWLSW